MVYKESFIAVIKNKGKVLREHRDGDDIVYLPYGSEYSITLKNMNTVKALVKVEIDGRVAIENLIIQPNSTVDLERFFENNMNQGHKFKFIEKTNDIKEFRGDKVDDGFIRIEFQFETEKQAIMRYLQYSPGNTYYWNDTPNIVYGSGNILPNNNTSECNVSNSNVSLDGLEEIDNEDGITVEGEISNQGFTNGYIGQLENKKNCIIIQLKGRTDKHNINKPITTKEKIQCKYCGKKSKSGCKFCPNCGAALM